MVILEMTRKSLHAMHEGFFVVGENSIERYKCHKTYLKLSPESKPYLSCKEQIILLKDRGLIIDDEKFALMQLETISYYSLINSYSHFFKQKVMNSL